MLERFDPLGSTSFCISLQGNDLVSERAEEKRAPVFSSFSS